MGIKPLLILGAILLCPLSLALPDNLGFEFGNLSLWVTTYEGLGLDYTSTVSANFSTEGNYSVFFGGSLGYMNNFDTHYTAINHTTQIIHINDTVCVDVKRETTGLGNWKLSSLLFGTLMFPIPEGEYNNSCHLSPREGKLDIIVAGMDQNCGSTCRAKIYADNIRIYTCNDTLTNGNESDVDCGKDCTHCLPGRSCNVAEDCLSGSCTLGVCDAPETCSNLAQDGSEEGIDCGSACNISCERALLERYAPVLYFHPDEQFFPSSIEAMLNESNLTNGSYVFDSNPVDKISLSAATDKAYLDMIGASGGLLSEEVPSSLRFSNYSKIVYARNTTRADKIIIQYWFFYPYNDWKNNHEGDWEMIQITLNKSDNYPLFATYSWHFGGTNYNWSSLEKDNLTHPRIFITLGGHGSWNESGAHYWEQKYADSKFVPCDTLRDDTSNQGPILYPSWNYSLIQLDETSSTWLNFSGRWGEVIGTGTSGPQGPKFIDYGTGNRWEDPTVWSDQPLPPLYAVCTGSPVDINVYDEHGNYIGLNSSGNPTSTLNNSYLQLTSENGKESIVILTSESLFLVINSTGNGTFNLSLSYFDKNSSVQISAKYQDIEISNTSVSYLNLSIFNPNYVLQIDFDGDGEIDNTSLPTNLSTQGNYTLNESDADNDGIADSIDNCPSLYNPSQNEICSEENDNCNDISCQTKIESSSSGGGKSFSAPIKKEEKCAGKICVNDNLLSEVNQISVITSPSKEFFENLPLHPQLTNTQRLALMGICFDTDTSRLMFICFPIFTTNNSSGLQSMSAITGNAILTKKSKFSIFITTLIERVQNIIQDLF